MPSLTTIFHGIALIPHPSSKELMTTHIVPFSLHNNPVSCAMNTYIFSYYLIQFCGHSWIFTNMIIRFLSFGEDAVADTFYSIGLVMRVCQSLSVLELFHIWLGLEEDRFSLKLFQITERIIILFVVIASQEEVQGKSVVCILFFCWSFIDVVRYTYCMLAVTRIYFQGLTWLHYTLWIPFYPLSVLAEAFAICESLPHFENTGTYSIQRPFPLAIPVYFPYVLKLYMAILFGGTYFIIRYLYKERKAHLESLTIKAKRS